MRQGWYAFVPLIWVIVFFDGPTLQLDLHLSINMSGPFLSPILNAAPNESSGVERVYTSVWIPNSFPKQFFFLLRAVVPSENCC